jgi:DNA polymerase III delta prime subunit
VCAACRKVLRDIHPDVLTVRDDEHRDMAVDVVRAARTDAYIRPNEGARKIYLFPDCGVVTERDQNVLLKIVEEGPPYAAFLFCAENPAVVLPTLRSRCVELKLRPAQTAQEDGAAFAAGETLCRTAGRRRRGAVTELLVEWERSKLSREDLSAALAEAEGLYTSALAALYGAPAPARRRETAALLAKTLTKTQIMRTIELLQTYRKECVYNVGVGQVLGALAAELEEIP